MGLVKTAQGDGDMGIMGMVLGLMQHSVIQVGDFSTSDGMLAVLAETFDEQKGLLVVVLLAVTSVTPQEMADDLELLG